MKKIIIILSAVIICCQITFAQQIIQTNTKSTCTYQGTATLQGCVAENLNVIFTFNENQKTFIHNVNGVDSQYAIENRTYESPYWSYRISNGEGVMYDMKANQATKEFIFYPVNLVNGATVLRYTFN